jgi:hypothetical protein
MIVSSITASIPRAVIPIVAGACVAALSAALADRLPMMWVLLIIVGCAAFIPAIVAKDPLAYWLTLFLLALPLNIWKRLGDVDRIVSVLRDTGALPGALPTPVLQLTDIPLLMMLIIWAVRMAIRKEGIHLSRAGLVPLALLSLMTVTSVIAPYPSVSFFELYRQCKFFIIFLFVSNNLDVKKYGRQIIAILLLGLVLESSITLVRYKFEWVGSLMGGTFGRVGESESASAYGMEEAAMDPEEAAEDVALNDPKAKRRGFGTFLHPNATAMYFELVLPFALVLTLISPGIKKKAFYFVAFLIGVAGLFVTFSRGGMVGFLISTMVCIYIAHRRGFVPMAVLTGLISTALIVGAVVVPAYLTTRPEYFTARFDHLLAGIRVVLSHPIIGVGLNNSSLVRSLVAPGGETEVERALPIHSHYMIGLAEVGVLGFALYVGFFIWIGVYALRLSTSPVFHTAVFGIAVVGAYCAIATHLLIDFLNNDAFHTLLWFYAGLIVAQTRTEQRERAAAPVPQQRS